MQGTSMDTRQYLSKMFKYIRANELRMSGTRGSTNPQGVTQLAAKTEWPE